MQLTSLYIDVRLGIYPKGKEAYIIKKLLDYETNVIVFVLTYHWRQIKKVYKCLTSKDYEPTKFYW